MVDQHGVVYVISVERASCDLAVSITDSPQYSFFWYKHHKFCYHYRECVFKHVEGLDTRETLHGLTHRYNGIHSEQRPQYLHWYGANSIDVKVGSFDNIFKDTVREWCCSGLEVHSN